MKLLLSLLISLTFLPVFAKDVQTILNGYSSKKKFKNFNKRSRKRFKKKKTNYGEKIEYIVDFAPEDQEHNHSVSGVIFHDEEDGHFELLEKDSIVVSRKSKSQKIRLVNNTAADATGNKRTLVIGVADPDANATSPIYGPGFLARAYFDNSNPSLNTYFKEASSNKVSFSGSVDERLFVIKNLCTTGNIFETGAVNFLLEIVDEEIDLSVYDRLSFVFPEDDTCLGGALGVATLGPLEFTNFFGKPTKIGLSYNISAGAGIGNSTYFLKVATHEMGHNFGLQHDNASSCGQGIFQGDCDSLEYGGVHSIMGFSPNLAHPNAIHQMDLKWLTNDQVVLIDQDNTQVEITLKALAADTDTGIKAIKIQREDGTFYAVEYRSPFGMENLSYAVQNLSYGGLQIYYNNDNNVNVDFRSDSALINSNLETFSATDRSQYLGLLSSSSFVPGNVFYDPISDIRITPISVNASEARVLVEKTFVDDGTGSEGGEGSEDGGGTTDVEDPSVSQSSVLNLNSKGITKTNTSLVYTGDTLTNSKIRIRVPKAYRKLIKVRKKPINMNGNSVNVRFKLGSKKKFEKKLSINDDGQYSIPVLVRIFDQATKSVIFEGSSSILVSP